MRNSWEADKWQGVRFPDRGQLRIEGITYDANDNTMRQGSITVRSDVWPQWLKIAGDELAAARAARESNPGLDGGTDFDRAILSEYRSSMVSICAVAFTFEAFTNSVAEYCPNVRGGKRLPAFDNHCERRAATARFHQIWLRAFRFSNVNSAKTKKTLEQVFALRNEAVHASAEFVEPINHATYPVALERKFLVYTVENADIAYRLAVDALAHLLGHPRGDDSEWTEWCNAMSERLQLMQIPPTPPAP